MSDHEDAFCPECGHNIGPGTLDSIGCPVCGYSEDEGEDASIILRVSRHEATPSHVAALEAAFGDDISVITEDVPYGDDPVAAVQAVIDRLQLPDDFDQEDEVVAVEAAGPEPVLQALVEGLDVPVIRPVFRRENGRVVVVGKDASGRDIFDVERYERLAVEVRPTLVGKPL